MIKVLSAVVLRRLRTMEIESHIVGPGVLSLMEDVCHCLSFLPRASCHTSPYLASLCLVRGNFSLADGRIHGGAAATRTTWTQPG